MDPATISAVAGAVALGVLHAWGTYKQIRKTDTDNSLELVDDVLPVVVEKIKERVAENGDEKVGLKEGLDAGVELVKELRGKRRLARAQVRKLRARIQRMLPDEHRPE